MSSGINYKSEFDWDISTSGVTIIKYKGKDRNVVFPREIDGKPVTSIGRSAFEGCSGLTSITLPDSLTGITFPDGSMSIGDGAFKDCIGLTSVTLPDGLTRIGEEIFSGCCGLTSITLPEGLTNIRENAFEGCNLKDVWYTGSRDQWEKILTDHGRRLCAPDNIFGNATIHFCS